MSRYRPQGYMDPHKYAAAPPARRRRAAPFLRHTSVGEGHLAVSARRWVQLDNGDWAQVPS